MSGKIYFGKSEDGSDMKEFEVMFVHPNGETWSNAPFIVKNPYAGIEIQKRFVCKGRHQYRKKTFKDENNITHTNWTCECGKSC